MEARISRFIRFFGPVIMWMGIIFLFSSLPARGTSEIYWQDFLIKKSAHVVEFGVLTMLLYRALLEYGIDKKRAGAYAVLFAMIYGVGDEFHQSFTPGREPHIRDVLFDTIGAVIFVYLIWNILPKAPGRLRNWARSYQLL